MFSTPTTTLGEVNGWPSRVSCSPAGLVWNVMVEVRGRTSRVTSVISPAESTTWRWIRNQTFADTSATTGTTKEPLVIPLVGGRNGWKCVLWWKLTHQV